MRKNIGGHNLKFRFGVETGCMCRKGSAAYLSVLNVELINDTCALLFLIFIMNASHDCH